MNQTTSHPNFNLESELLQQGYTYIAGIDEAGRGCLAGPLAVGIVMYDLKNLASLPKELLANINDSKKLSSKKREYMHDFIKEQALLCETQLVSHKIIDEKNINGATEYAINTLLKKMKTRVPYPDIILLDGNFSFELAIPYQNVKMGDSMSISIASASIAAKVRRDSIISKFDSIYSGYNFSKHKGYGTAEHRDLIIKIGPSPIHRISYGPIKSLIK